MALAVAVLPVGVCNAGMHIAFAHHEPIDETKARWVAMVRTLAALGERGRVTWFTPDSPARIAEYAQAHLGLKLPAGLTPHKLPHVHKFAGLTLNSVFFRACRKALASSGADVLYLRSDKLAAHFARRGTPAPLVYEAHLVGPLWAQDKGAGADKVRRLEQIERTLYAKAAGVAAITQGLLDEIRSRFGYAGPAAIVPSGVDLDAFPRVWDGGDGATVVYVGTLKFWKGLATLLDALVQAPGLRLLLVGGGSREEQQQLEARMAELGLTGRVELAGRLPQPQIAARVRHAACAVHPLPPEHSISSRFTSPLKVVEYLALGLPVVAADVPSAREVLRDGETARLFAPGDAASLAAALQEVCGSRELAARLSAAGHDAAAGYSYAVRAEKLLGLFGEVAWGS